MNNKEREYHNQPESSAKATALVLAVVILAGGYTAWRVADSPNPNEIIDGFQSITRERLTDEQEKAAEFLNSAPEEDLIRDAKALSVKNNEDQYQGPNIRNRPATAIIDGDFQKAGEDTGDLEPGTKIEKAIVVRGPDPTSAYGSNDGLWLAFFDPQDPTRVVFADSTLFVLDDYRLHKVKLYVVN